MFEFLLGLFLLYLLYKIFIKSRFQPKPKAPKGKAKRRPVYGTPMVVEEMKRCPTCGTFNPKSLALVDKEQYFCSIECRTRFNS